VNKPLGTVLSIWAGLIVASTFFVNQGYIADMIFSLALAFTFAWLYNKFIVKKPAVQ
jgi:hypothetical protein